MKRYHGVSPLEQKRSMPAWLAKPSFVIGLLIVLVVILMALFPQFIAPYDPIATDVTVSNQAPSAAHWFGTDFYGRDIFSRVIWGTRIDLLIGVLGVVIPFLVHFSWPAALLPGTLAALCDETIQLFVPGRSGQITDVWLDTAGYLTGALLTLLIFFLCRKRPKQRKTP